MMTAVNRLKGSLAKSKLMIVLTDGQPTPGDIDPQVVIDIAKKMGIKIYTVGIGAKDGGYLNHSLFGVVKTGEIFNQKLLEQIAVSTGGLFFGAKNADDMHQIYNRIDELETTVHQTSVFTKKYEFFGILIMVVLVLLLLELFLAYFVWFGI
jgi:Ca-activated chloride channel family protein